VCITKNCKLLQVNINDVVILQVAIVFMSIQLLSLEEST